MMFPVLVLTAGFSLIGGMIGLAAMADNKGAMSILIGLAAGAAFGCFLGLWGSVEPDER